VTAKAQHLLFLERIFKKMSYFEAKINIIL